MKLLFFIALFSCLSFGQQYPKDFISPLGIPLDVSGSFGELRNNHFHSGLDFKTQKREGLPVYAVGTGYISRIKISTYGYGKAIYITHPNGFTTVYGHLQKANGIIEDYIKSAHYSQKSFEIELFLKPNELPVEQGEIIAFSGNSGGSGGPHLHFEFRETTSEKTINPLFFGFNKLAEDKHAPEVQSVIVYPVDSTVVNKSQRPIPVSINKQADGSYLAAKVIANGKIGFGINAFDYCTNLYNKNGLYKVNAYLNGVLYYQFELEKFAFDESRYINNFIDYEHFKTSNQRIQKLFHYSPYPLSVLKINKNNGIINTQPNTNYNFRIELYDFHENKTVINIPIEFGVQPVSLTKKEQKTPYFLKAKNEHNYSKENISVYIPENTFYDNFYLNFEVNDNVLTLHNESIPVHKNITITFDDVQGFTEEQLQKSFIASVSGPSLRYNKSYRKGNTFKTYTKNLGKFKIAQDSISPRIYNVNFIEGKNIISQETLSVFISDNLSGIDSYNAYLNGEWILMEYDYKTKKLIHQLSDGKFKEGRNDFKVIVVDNMQNSTTFESHFFMNN